MKFKKIFVLSLPKTTKYEKECNNKIKTAVDAGMNQVEAKSDYGSFFDISGVTVVIKSVNNSNTVIYSRKFK